jgi:hypothetical protein
VWGFRVWGFVCGSKVECLNSGFRFRVKGLEFRVRGLGFGVEDLGFKV